MRTLPRLVVLVAMLSGGTALARRQPQEYQPPPEMTLEEREAAKARAMGGNINAYDKDTQPKEQPMPWAAIGLAGLVFLAATPFALRAYRNASKELGAVNTLGSSSSRDRKRA